MGRAHELLERKVLRAGSKEPMVALYRNEVGSGYVGAIRSQLERMFEDTIKVSDRRTKAVLTALQAKVARLLQRSRITWGLGVGSPDLVGSAEGNALGIEIKEDNDRLSSEQRKWHEAARALGWTVGEARSVEQALALIEEARNGHH